MNPNSNVDDLLQSNSKEKVEEVKNKLLLSEVIQNQLKENMTLTENDNEKKIFKKVLSCKIVKKYKVLNQINMLKYLCCDRNNENCLMRECFNCKRLSIYSYYNEFDNSVAFKFLNVL